MAVEVLYGKDVNLDREEVRQEQRITRIEQRLSDIESIHPELQPRVPTPPHKTILKWVFFLILVGGLIYGIYLYYLYDKGWNIALPF